MAVSLPTETSSYCFGTFELDEARQELRREGAIVPIAPKPLSLLFLLVRNRERVVTREEALAAVWPDVRVSPATLASTLRDLRRVLDDDADAPVFVQTARGIGFRFLAPVEAHRLRGDASGRSADPRGDLVGRDAILEQLEARLAAASGGRGGLVVLEGESGMGKTRILEALAEAARARGALVASARFPESGKGPAFRPWAALLGRLAEPRSRAWLEQALDARLPWLARLVPELTEGPATEPLGAADDESSTLRMFDAATRLLRRLADDQPLVLVLDDLHGADRSSLRLLEHVAEHVRDGRILIAVAYRSSDLDPEHPLAASLAELSRLPGWTRVRLEGIDRMATRSLVEAVIGRDPGEARIAEIHARTDGNPFYIRELARYLAEAAPDLPARSVPESLRELLLGRLQRLPLRCRDALELAAVIGREFDLELLRRSSGLGVSGLMEALDIGRRAGIVDAGWGQHRRFQHALAQEAIYAGLPEARRRLLHRRVGEACRSLLSPDRGELLAVTARHLCQVAEEAGEPAVGTAASAAEHAEAHLAFEEAAHLYRMALDALDRIDAGNDERRCRLLLALAHAQLRAGELGQAIGTARRAAALARAIRRPELLASAALLFGDYVLVDSSEARELLEEAIPALGPAHEAVRGRSLAALANALWYDGQADRRRALADEALEIARAIGDPTQVVAARMAQHHARIGPAHLTERLLLADRALREADRADQDALRCLVLSWRAVDLLESGDRTAAERDVARLEDLARHGGLRRYLDQPPRWRALLAMLEGRFSDAEAWITESARLRQRADLPTTESYAGAQLSVLLWERGRRTELEVVLLQAEWFEFLRQRMPAAAASAAFVELEAGRPGAARRLLTDLAQAEWAALRDDPEPLLTVSFLAEICVRLEAREPAEALYQRHAAYGDRFACLYSVLCRGSFERYLGLLAVAAGRPAEAAGRFEAALAANRAVGAVLYEAWAQWEYARLLAGQGEHVRARALAQDAAATADRLGLHRLREEIDAGGTRLALGAA
jgi:DNA-binding winged helix-turn-helix (wHTH) protein